MYTILGYFKANHKINMYCRNEEDIFKCIQVIPKHIIFIVECPSRMNQINISKKYVLGAMFTVCVYFK